MSSTAWKDLERRVCRALGANRRPSVGTGGYARGTDDDGTAPFAVEVKRTKRWQLRGTWLTQARQNGKATARPWLLVIATHGTPRPVAILDFWTFVQLVEEAGRLPTIDPKGEAMSEQSVPEPPTDRRAEEPDDDTPPDDDDDAES